MIRYTREENKYTIVEKVSSVQEIYRALFNSASVSLLVESFCRKQDVISAEKVGHILITKTLEKICIYIVMF